MQGRRDVANNVTVIVKLGGMGDLLMASPAIRAYRKSFPDRKIVMCTGISNRSIFKNNENVDVLITCDDRRVFGGGFFARVDETIKLIRELRRVRPDTVFVLHRDWRWNAVGWLSGAKRRYGFRRDLGGLFLSAGAVDNKSKHDSEKYYEVFKLSGELCKDGTAMDLPVSAEDKTYVSNLLAENLGSGEAKSAIWVAVAPGGAKNAKMDMDLKRWPLSHYKELIALISRNAAWNVALIGSSDDKKYTVELVGHDCKVVDYSGRTTPSQTCELLRHCKVLVANDAGPMHLGAAAGIPVVGLFGPTNPVETYAYTNAKSIYLWKGETMSCSPCYKDGKFPQTCPYDKKCMKTIDPKEVFDTVANIVYSA